MLQELIHITMDQMSNDEYDDLVVEDEWIDAVGENIKRELKKSLSPRPKDFRIRGSNVGRPTCVLQMQKSGAEPSRKPYHFVMQMLHGYMIEEIMTLILKVANANITGGKAKVSLDLEGVTIKGEDDIQIEGKEYDVKSCSPWAFTNKWSEGYGKLKSSDNFGYVGQLMAYSEAQNIPVGGWIVVNKSSGEVAVVDADNSPSERKEVLDKLKSTVRTVTSDAPFKRCFDPIEDSFRKKPTGRKFLDRNNCGMCDYKTSCYPGVKYKAQPESTAVNPPFKWYVSEV
jgi:hypothetical protein